MREQDNRIVEAHVCLPDEMAEGQWAEFMR